MYRSVTGDTFAKISRKVYGYESGATGLKHANPGLFDPIPADSIVVIPTVPGAPVDTLQGAPGELDELVLTINAKRFRFWDGVTIKKSLDSVDTLELTAPFEPDNAEFRDHFRPFAYPRITASLNGAVMFTGTLTTVNPASSSDGVAVAAGAYSLPGVLVDCCAPASIYAEAEGLEFLDADLRRIATRLLQPFGLEAVFVDPPGKTFEAVSVKPSSPVMPFLAKLAKQRNLVITSDVSGRVVFWRASSGGAPVAVLSAGNPGPVISVSPAFSTQAYYSHVTGIEPTSLGLDGGQHTEKNTRLPGVLRPYTFEVTDAAGEDLTTATRAKIGRMFGDAVSYAVEVDTWRDPSGALWAPNTTVILEHPNAMIYGPYEFLIRDVDFRRVRDGATATLGLVIPAAYRGEVPERMPWD